MKNERMFESFFFLFEEKKNSLVIGQHQNHQQILKQTKDESIVVEFVGKFMPDQVHLKLIYVLIRVKR